MKREELLSKLIRMDASIEFLNLELAKFGWDSEKDLVILKKHHILEILNKFLRGEIKQQDIANWAEAIECREDIGFETNYKKLISEIIFDLANFDVAGILTENKAKIFIAKLGSIDNK